MNSGEAGGAGVDKLKPVALASDGPAAAEEEGLSLNNWSSVTAACLVSLPRLDVDAPIPNWSQSSSASSSSASSASASASA